MVFPDSLYIERLMQRLQASGNRTCLRHNGRDIAAGDFLNHIYRYARTLDGLQISGGDVVALLAPNHPDALALRYAAHLIGAGATFLSIPSALEDRAELIRTVDPKLLIVFPETHSFVPPGTAVPLVGVGPGSGDRMRLNEAAADQSCDPVDCRAR